MTHFHDGEKLRPQHQLHTSDPLSLQVAAARSVPEDKDVTQEARKSLEEQASPSPSVVKSHTLLSAHTSILSVRSSSKQTWTYLFAI